MDGIHQQSLQPPNNGSSPKIHFSFPNQYQNERGMIKGRKSEWGKTT
jgi:hypothetical protein